jgi:hypothetical protein
MKRLSDTVFHSDDRKVVCAMTYTGQFAYMENDPQGVKLLKMCDTLKEAKEMIAGYEKAMNQFWEVFK